MYLSACCMAPQFDLLNPLRFSLPLEPQIALDPLNPLNTAHQPHLSSVHLDSVRKTSFCKILIMYVTVIIVN